jgi:hypothetical protein
MEENRRSIASYDQEERGAASALTGPARRSLRRWARPAPYTPSPRRFISDFLSKPSPPIRSLLDTPRSSLPRLYGEFFLSFLVQRLVDVIFLGLLRFVNDFDDFCCFFPFQIKLVLLLSYEMKFLVLVRMNSRWEMN